MHLLHIFIPTPKGATCNPHAIEKHISILLNMASITPSTSATTQSSSPEKISLWSSSQAAHEAEEVRFAGFEPCYIACIKDLELRISNILEDSVGNGNGVDVPNGLEELLLRYCILA